MKFQDLIMMYDTFIAKVEDFTYKKILPPLFKLMLFGMKLTLAWAFYQTIKQASNELF